MADARKQITDSETPPGGIGRDLRRIKTESRASLAELREFVGRMQGKSPQEMLGVLAQSRLAVNILVSTVGCAVLMFACSIIPYWLNGAGSQIAANAAKTKKAARTAARSPQKKTAAAAVTGTQKTAPSSLAPKIPKQLKPETKTGVPNIDKLIEGDK